MKAKKRHQRAHDSAFPLRVHVKRGVIAHAAQPKLRDNDALLVSRIQPSAVPVLSLRLCFVIVSRCLSNKK